MSHFIRPTDSWAQAHPFSVWFAYKKDHSDLVSRFACVWSPTLHWFVHCHRNVGAESEITVWYTTLFHFEIHFMHRSFTIYKYECSDQPAHNEWYYSHYWTSAHHRLSFIYKSEWRYFVGISLNCIQRRDSQLSLWTGIVFYTDWMLGLWIQSGSFLFLKDTLHSALSSYCLANKGQGRWYAVNPLNARHCNWIHWSLGGIPLTGFLLWLEIDPSVITL